MDEDTKPVRDTIDKTNGSRVQEKRNLQYLIKETTKKQRTKKESLKGKKKI